MGISSILIMKLNRVSQIYNKYTKHSPQTEQGINKWKAIKSKHVSARRFLSTNDSENLV